MKNQYGNYVVQRLFEEGDHNIKSIMYYGVNANPLQLGEIKKDNYARFVYGFMEKYFDGSSNFQPKSKGPKSVKSNSSQASNKSAKKGPEQEYEYQPVSIVTPVPVYGTQMGYGYQMVSPDMASMGMMSPEMIQQMMMQGGTGTMGYIMVPTAGYQKPAENASGHDNNSKGFNGSGNDKFSDIERRRNQSNQSPAFENYNKKKGFTRKPDDKLKSQTPPPPVRFLVSL